jgi:hypothetical protein
VSAKPISQAEARRLRKRVEELEARETKLFSTWATTGYIPGSISLANRQLDIAGWMFGRLQTARRLGCALVCTIDDQGNLNYYAVKR